VIRDRVIEFVELRLQSFEVFRQELSVMEDGFVEAEVRIVVFQCMEGVGVDGDDSVEVVLVHHLHVLLDEVFEKSEFA
jgi:hypothetical protein